ncbi:SsrA-binding protein [Limimonas halophila]|uniref:SsrA-binding protein n=1 Tax=Limimonas halophila TaxID=1082479 RepID=A0A1G7P281_9PROT|nr:SsrA-binding protein SmpB [Limimonas halophila]SDF80405.1 SsrA-binding protein [Limimonas halophila]
MAQKKKKDTKPFTEFGTVAVNRRARYDYSIEEEIEAGLVLHGSEVKALREGKCSIKEAYAAEKHGELWLMNAHIGEYSPAMFNHKPRRQRKLLIHRRELKNLLGQINQKGYTLVPMQVYFNNRGLAKIKLGLARGKRKVDKRETEKERDWQRRKRQVIREYS